MPEVKCNICNKPFHIKPSHQKLGYGKYCSKPCQYEGKKKGKYVNCYICNKETWKTPKNFKKSKSGKLFCSKSCQTKWRNKYYSGSLHPNWKSGANIDYRKILLESSVKQVCKKCKCNDKRLLVVHHIDKDRKNNKTKNLIWLCLNCHYLVHNHTEPIDMVVVA